MSPIARTDASIRRCHVAAATLLASALLGLAVAAQAVGYDDLRSPDTRDAALQAQQTPTADLRSPDTRDAAVRTQQAPAALDLRSPDTRDVASGLGQAPAPTRDAAGDVNWVYLALGGLALVVAGGALTARRRRVKRPAMAVGG